jgi:tetratricopeptide (TPR) repeat protein
MNFESMTEQEILGQLPEFDDLGRADALYVLANRQASEGRFEEAVSFSGAAREIFTRLSEDYEAAEASYVEGYAMLHRDEPVGAKELFEAALEVYSFRAPDQMIADVYYNLALCSIRLHDDDAAIEHHQRASEFYKSADQIALAARSKKEIGEILGSHSKQKLALGAFGEAMRLYREAEFLLGVSRVHDRLAAVYLDLGDDPQALIHLREAWNLVSFMNQENNIGYSQKRLGETLISERQFEEAEGYLERAIADFKARDEFVLAAKTEQSLAKLYDKTGRQDKANVLLQSCLSVFSGAGDEVAVLLLRKYQAERKSETDINSTIAEYEAILGESISRGYPWLSRQLQVTLSDLYLTRSVKGDKSAARNILKNIDEQGFGDELYIKLCFWLVKSKVLMLSKDKDPAKHQLNRVLNLGKGARFEPLWQEARELIAKIDDSQELLGRTLELKERSQ